MVWEAGFVCRERERARALAPTPPAPPPRRMLTLPDGGRLPVPVGGRAPLGRFHVRHSPGAAAVSRYMRVGWFDACPTSGTRGLERRVPDAAPRMPTPLFFRHAVEVTRQGAQGLTATVIGTSLVRLRPVVGPERVLARGSSAPLAAGDALVLTEPASKHSTVRVTAVAGSSEDREPAEAPTVKRPRPPPVLLVLVGLPGSGKSMLAAKLAAAGWAVACQDTVRAGGKPGTKAACVAAAARALAAGTSVVVDRTNLTVDQRAPFVAAAAAAGAAAHALHLSHGRAACADRAAARTTHPSGVAGPRARSVVGRLAAGGVVAPTAGEGFASVAAAPTDAAADAAASRWAGRGAPQRSAMDALMGARGAAAAAAPASPPPPPRPAWAGGTALLAVAADPTSHPHATLSAGGRAVLLADAFPKAARHALALPAGRPPAIPATPADLAGSSGAALVRELAAAGAAWAREHAAPGGAPFRLGFHSAPSMRPLHLHVISQDLDSAYMKTKKHYNSFKAPFFVDAETVAAALDAGKRPPLLDAAAADAALRAPLACHRCGQEMKTMPALKKHLGECSAPYPVL